MALIDRVCFGIHSGFVKYGLHTHHQFISHASVGSDNSRDPTIKIINSRVGKIGKSRFMRHVFPHPTADRYLEDFKEMWAWLGFCCEVLVVIAYILGI